MFMIRIRIMIMSATMLMLMIVVIVKLVECISKEHAPKINYGPLGRFSLWCFPDGSPAMSEIAMGLEGEGDRREGQGMGSIRFGVEQQGTHQQNTSESRSRAAYPWNTLQRKPQWSDGLRPFSTKYVRWVGGWANTCKTLHSKT